MFKAFLHRIGLALSNYLMTEVDGHALTPPVGARTLRKWLRPGDVLLIEGATRVSGPIKYLTQSTWSHAALYAGPLPGRAEPDGEDHVLIEAELVGGVCASPLSKYARSHTRICRPVHLREEDLAALVNFASSRIGYKYDLHNLFDLMRYMLPAPPIPSRLRRRFIGLGASSPTRALCSTLLAEAFQHINYPVLPVIEFVDDDSAAQLSHHTVREILHIRSSSLYVPRDFDISPFFAVVKPMIEQGFDYKKLEWTEGSAAL
jgi:hypothetical protein